MLGNIQYPGRLIISHWLTQAAQLNGANHNKVLGKDYCNGLQFAILIVCRQNLTLFSVIDVIVDLVLFVVQQKEAITMIITWLALIFSLFNLIS